MKRRFVAKGQLDFGRNRVPVNDSSKERPAVSLCGRPDAHAIILRKTHRIVHVVLARMYRKRGGIVGKEGPIMRAREGRLSNYTVYYTRRCATGTGKIDNYNTAFYSSNTVVCAVHTARKHDGLFVRRKPYEFFETVIIGARDA